MTILITGGSRGLGRALVETLATDSVNQILFTYCHHKEEAQALTDRFQNVRATQVDFCNEDAALALGCRSHFLRGERPNGDGAQQADLDAFCTGQFDGNIIPFICITQACLKGMRKRKFGKIVNIITSYVIDVPPTGFSVYTATKAYIRQLSKSISKELGRFNITSNCILPDYMQTDFGQVEDFQLDQMKDSHPLKELLKPQDVAEFVASLLKASQQLNGAEIPINAAQHII